MNFCIRTTNDEIYLVTYNFEEQSLTYIGKVDKGFGEFRYFRHNSIEYKDEVYFVAVVEQENVRLKVGKLYQTSQQEEVIFDNIIDHILPKPSLDMNFILFIKNDILCIYVFEKGLLFSLDLQIEQAELQQHQSPVLLYNPNFNYAFCFNNPYIYYITQKSMCEIDCTDITNMNIKSKESLEWDLGEISRQGVFLNGKIYYIDPEYFYQVDIETKTMKRFSLKDALPFGRFNIRKFYITSKNEIRVLGYIGLYFKQYFIEITFGDGDNTM